MSFVRALDLWDSSAVGYGPERFFRDWVGRSCAVVEGAAEHAGFIPPDWKTKLDSACTLLADNDLAESQVKTFIWPITQHEDWTKKQIINVARGMCFGVRSACRLHAWQAGAGASLPSEAISDLSACFAGYHAAWDLWTPLVASPVSTAAYGSSPDRATAILDVFSQSFGAIPPAWLTESNWLLVRRLLAYILDSGAAENSVLGDPGCMKMLLVQGPDGNGDYIGLSAPVTVAAYDEGWPSPYLDPVEMGITVLDDIMLNSLRIAARVCRPELEKKHDHVQKWHSTSLRIGPNLRERRVAVLTGASAGGLLTVGAVAKAWGARLNQNMTASFVIRCPQLKKDEPTQVLKAGDITIEAVAKSSLPAKLDCASAERFTTVFLGELPTRYSGKKLHQWAHAAGRQPTLSLALATSIPDVIHAMTGDERIEQVLAGRCDAIVEEWVGIKQASDSSAASNTDKQEYDEHRFDRYVAPTFQLERPLLKPVLPGEHTGEPPESELVPTKGNECFFYLLDLLMKPNQARWLVVYDRAGAGKTVFSWRMRTMAASAYVLRRYFPNCPPLIVHLRGTWPCDENDRLLPLRELLERQLTAFPSTAGVGPTECVNYALKHRSVLMILDGFDQFSPEEQQHVAMLLQNTDSLKANNEAINSCRWIITSRVHAIDAWRAELFDDRRWLRVRIDPFSQEQQDEYFKDIPRPWRQMVPPEAANDLLGLPLVLRLLRRILETTGPSDELPQFPTLSALFDYVHRALLKRALEKSQKELRGKRLIRGSLSSDEQLRILENVLSLLAYQMLIDENYNGMLMGDGVDPSSPVVKFERRARNRYFHDIEKRIAAGGLPRNEKRDLKRCEKVMDNHWTWAIKVLKTIELNHRAVVEVHDPKRVAFRNRKVVEGYAARYLTRYATDWDLVGKNNLYDPDDPCAWSFLGDEQWKECFQLAIEMPLKKGDSEVAAKSFGLLFRRPKQPRKDVPSHRKLQLRPTELMFRAWQMMERTKFSGGDEILKDYRQQFLDILCGSDTSQAKLAAELVPHFHLQNLVRDHELTQERLDAIRPPEKHPAYVRCPPDENESHLTFWMGADDSGRGDEEPRHQVRVPAFWTAACTVTRGQYRLFDPHLEREYEANFQRFSPDDDCPVIQTNWWDGFCLGLWLSDAAGPPTETQWEGAARGERGSQKDSQGVIGIPPFNASFTTDQVNFNGTYSLAGKTSHWLQRTLPVRWDADRQKQSERTNSPAAKVSAYQANGWGIWHAHGNVWEWTRSESDAGLYSKRAAEGSIVSVAEEDVSNCDASAGRVVRGGSWGSFADLCRSAARNVSGPNSRSDSDGIRLCWRGSGVSS